MTPSSRTLEFPRFVSWMGVGIAGAFLVVATQSFSPSAVKWLAFAISICTLVVSVATAYGYRRSIATVATSSATALVSAWMLVASLNFSVGLFQTLALASALAVCALALVGISVHELGAEGYVLQRRALGEPEPRLAATA